MAHDGVAKEGWALPGFSRKWHYFRKDGPSLCGKVGFYFGAREQGNDDSKDNCAECRKRKAKEATP
jgi:hypothetical protein